MIVVVPCTCSPRGTAINRGGLHNLRIAVSFSFNLLLLWAGATTEKSHISQPLEPSVDVVQPSWIKKKFLKNYVFLGLCVEKFFPK